MEVIHYLSDLYIHVFTFSKHAEHAASFSGTFLFYIHTLSHIQTQELPNTIIVCESWLQCNSSGQEPFSGSALGKITLCITHSLSHPSFLNTFRIATCFCTCGAAEVQVR